MANIWIIYGLIYGQTMVNNSYPLVNVDIAIQNDHFSGDFSHEKW